MLQKQIGVTSNSLHFNESSDEKLYSNYAALARWIAGVEVKGEVFYPSISQTCSAYGLYKDEARVRVTSSASVPAGTYTNSELMSVDITTGKVDEYKNGKELSEKIGLRVSNINGAIKKQSLYAGKYLINFKGSDDKKMIEDYRKSKGIKVKYKLTNAETNEEEIFDNTEKAGKYIGISSSGIRYALKHGGKIKGIWKVSKVREEYNG